MLNKLNEIRADKCRKLTLSVNRMKHANHCTLCTFQAAASGGFDVITKGVDLFISTFCRVRYIHVHHIKSAFMISFQSCSKAKACLLLILHDAHHTLLEGVYKSCVKKHSLAIMVQQHFESAIEQGACTSPHAAQLTLCDTNLIGVNNLLLCI